MRPTPRGSRAARQGPCRLLDPERETLRDALPRQAPTFPSHWESGLHLGAPKASQTNTWALGAHLVMSQLQGELHKSVGARPAFLDQRFSERGEGERVKIYVVGQTVGAGQGGLYHLLALETKKEKVC